MHDVIVVGVPLLAILAGILFNRNDFKDLRAADERQVHAKLRIALPVSMQI